MKRDKIIYKQKDIDAIEFALLLSEFLTQHVIQKLLLKLSPQQQDSWIIKKYILYFETRVAIDILTSAGGIYIYV